MSSDKTKKILRIVGILVIFGAIISVGYGISTVNRGRHAALLAGSDPAYQKSLSAMIGTGIGTLVSASFNLAEGIASVLASRNNRFAAPAWVCSLLSLISNSISGISSIVTSGFSLGALGGLILSIGMALQIYVAAGRLKNTYKTVMN